MGHHAGDGLRNQNYDICLCWLDTYAREQEVAFPHEMTNNINHLAAELMNGNIDFGYAMENTIEDHKTQDCEICMELDQDIWKDGTFSMAKTGLKFAAAGASGMLRKDRTALIRQINIGIDAFIADKAKYCPLCKTYWPLPNTCRSHCIECTDFCD